MIEVVTRGMGEGLEKEARAEEEVDAAAGAGGRILSKRGGAGRRRGHSVGVLGDARAMLVLDLGIEGRVL